MDWKWSLANFLGFTPPHSASQHRGEQAACVPRTFFWEQENVSNLDNWVTGWKFTCATTLNKKGFDKNNPNHVLISLGDLLDRGPDPIKCLEFVNSLPRKILIKGNHEDLLDEAIKRKIFLSHDFHNKTVDTALKISNIRYEDDFTVLEKMASNELWNTYYNSCIDFAETDKYIFVHGWIPTTENSSDWRDGDWEKARWLNGMQEWSIGNRPQDKTVYCGHFHASYGHHYIHNKGPEWNDDLCALLCGYATISKKANFKTFKDTGIRALDACTVVSGFCNCETVSISKRQLEKYLGK